LFNPEIIYKGVSVFAVALGLPVVDVPYAATFCTRCQQRVDSHYSK